MKRHASLICALALLAAESCAMSAVFGIISRVEGMENTDPGFAIWLICLSLCHIGMTLFLRRERSEREIILFCGAFFILQTIIIFAVHGLFSSLVGILTALCMWLYSYYNCYDMAMNSLTPEKLTKVFDLCSLVLIFLLLFCSVKELSFNMVLPLAVSTLLCLFALVLIRGGEQRKMRSIIISLALVLGFGLIAGLFVALASGGIKKLLGFLSAAVSVVLNFLLRCIDAVFRFLASLFPEKQYDMELMDPIEGASLGAPQDMDFSLVDPEVMVAVLIGLGLCAVAAMVIYHIVKGGRAGLQKTAGGEQGIRCKKSRLLPALKKAFSKLWHAVLFRIRTVTGRNTAPGLFWQIEKRSRAKLHGRKKSETCREFLMRAESVYPHAHKELNKLADALDSIYYGGDTELSPAEINNLRRVIFNGVDKE